MDELAVITRTEGDRHGESTLDSGHRAHSGLGGGAGHEGTNLMAGRSFHWTKEIIRMVGRATEESFDGFTVIAGARSRKRVLSS